MTNPQEFHVPPDPDWIQELLAGHALGNLDPEEIEQLQQILRESPDLELEAQQLQETLELLPFALPLTPPPQKLRSRLCQISNPTRTRPTSLQIPWVAIAITGLGLLVSTWVGDRYRLHHQIATLQTQLEQAVEEPSGSTADSLIEMSLPPEVILANHWDGLDHLMSDHLRSVTQVQGPVDNASDQASELIQLLQNQTPLPQDLPQVLSLKNSLIGGSPCDDLGGTSGARFSFQYSREVILSFYVLARQERSQFPRAGSRVLHIQGPQQPGILLWEDQEFIYALVAQLPAETLQELALQAREI